MFSWRNKKIFLLLALLARAMCGIRMLDCLSDSDIKRLSFRFLFIPVCLSGSDIKRLDSCAEVFSQAGDANSFGDYGSEDSFILEVQCQS